MSSKFCTLECSSSSWEQKKATLAQEVARRLETTSAELCIDQKVQILDNFQDKLERSGYSNRQIAEIMNAGILGHTRKIRQRPERHRKGSETEGQRRLKHLTGRTSWYKIRKRKQERQEIARQNRKKDKTDKTESSRKDKKIETENLTPSSVLFIDRTEGGILAKRLKEKERELNKVSKKKVKIVEKNGDQIGQILTSSNPWGEERCDRKECLSCKTSKLDRGVCRDRNLVYETVCKLCKTEGETVSYIGETSRSLFERQREHARDCLSSNTETKSHLRDHWTECHLNENQNKQLETIQDITEVHEVKILEKYQTSLERQIGEAIHIRRATGRILNDKEEYNRCELPVLSVSRQRQKKVLTQDTVEIVRQTDKFQEEAGETKLKRRDRPNEETGSNIVEKSKETGERKVKRVRRKGKVNLQNPTEDIRYKQKDRNREVMSNEETVITLEETVEPEREKDDRDRETDKEKEIEKDDDKETETEIERNKEIQKTEKPPRDKREEQKEEEQKDKDEDRREQVSKERGETENKRK